MRYLTIILLFISSLAMAQRPYLFPTISDAASNTYIGIGAYVQTQGYSASGDGGGALYRMTAIASAPMAVDSGYVYPVTAGKVLVQVLEDEYLRTATYGVVCGSSAEATNNYNRLQRFFTAINTLDKQAFVNGCNDTIYVNFTSALTTTLTSHDKFVMRGEGADVTRIKATTGSIDFGFSDAAKVNLFDLYLDGYDATAFGGIGGADQSLTYVNDTLTISGGNYVVITGGGGGGTDDQTISIDSNAFKYTLSIESGNSVTFAKVTDTDTDDQTLSFSSPNLSISEGNSVDLSALQDGTGTDDQTLSIDSTVLAAGTARKFTLSIEGGNSVSFIDSIDGGGSGTPGGTHNDIQFNRSGSFTGTDSLEWDGASGYLGLTGNLISTGRAYIGRGLSNKDFEIYDPENARPSLWINYGNSSDTLTFIGSTSSNAGAFIRLYNTTANASGIRWGGSMSISGAALTVESASLVLNGSAGIGHGNLQLRTNGSAAMFLSGSNNGRRVKIENAASTDADASAQLEIVSTTRGFLPPRMTETQRNAISSPATGLTIYCTDCTATDASTGVMQSYNGTSWKNYW